MRHVVSVVAGQWLSCGAPDRCHVWHEPSCDEARRQYPRRETETQVCDTEERPRTYVGWDGRGTRTRRTRMKYPVDLERERRTAEIVRQLREARAQVPPSYPVQREWRKAA
jgi:hypothetical protein